MKPWHQNLPMNEERQKRSSKPRKLQQQVQLRMQDPNLAKLKQTRASNKQQTSEQAPRGPTAAAGPQLCKVESNNNKQHRTNQRASINQ
jgi:hypothetical protein